MFNNFFQRFKEKAVQYLFNYSYGTPKWSMQNDESYIREAYNQIVWVYSCVSMISSAVGNVEWCLYSNKNGEKIEIEEHPILNLLNIKVNENMSSKDFFDLWATYLALNGKFFAVFDSPINPTVIEPLASFAVKPIPDIENFISGINYNYGNVNIDYSKNIVLWSKFIDPLDFYEGMSPIRAMSRLLDTENSAIAWNKNSLDNSAVPPGIMSMLNPTEQQINAVKQKWASNYSGKSNVRTPLILDSERATYQSLGINQVEMDFILQRKMNRIEICSGFGVPSQVVGDPEGQTYSNYNEALQAFWKNTVIPKYLNNIKGVLNQTLVPKFINLNGGELYIDYDLDDVECLQENQGEKIDKILNMYNNDFITLNEGRNALGWETTNFVNGDQLKSSVMSDLLAGDSGDVQIEEEIIEEENVLLNNESEEIEMEFENG